MPILNSRFISYLARNSFFKDAPLTIVDVGARGGAEPHWSCYGDAARIIGFEPDPEECKRLNAVQDRPPFATFYPFALFRDKGVHTFYHMCPAASGLYPVNQEFIRRFPNEEIFAAFKTSPLATTDYDSFTAENRIPDADFVKLDAEGAELDILEGFAKQLHQSVLGISCEVSFYSWRDGSRTFSEIEQFLRPIGFTLYDMNVWRFANKALPGIESVAPQGMASPNASHGRVIQGQALFFRDPVAELARGKLLLAEWDTSRIMKAVSLFAHFNLPDCAIELLHEAEKRVMLVGIPKAEIERFRNLITSDFLGRATSYARYFKKLARIKKRGYATLFDRILPYLRKVPYLKDFRNFARNTLRCCRSILTR